VNVDDMKQLAQLLQKMPGIKSIELKDVKRLAELLKESPEIGSIEVTGFFGTGVVITRTQLGGPMAQAYSASLMAPGNPASHAPAGPPAGAAPQPAPAVAVPSTLREIKSPMVGTYYKAPEPGADAYVKVGTRVTAGQTVCIIEAMKIMNEIEAELSGVVREICVEDGQPVEFGQVLFRVDPNG
jgi:acetyl-CoA carboxylase biotin carboxyl carrier protein